MEYLPTRLKLDSGKKEANEASFVLNGVVAPDKDSIYQTEPGNSDCYKLPAGYVEKGAINIDRDSIIIFSYNSTTENSEIGLVKDCVYTSIINHPELNLQWFVTGFVRIRNGCERVVYFNDWNNSDRILNLDKLEEIKTDGEWDVNKMKWNPDILNPCIEIEKINSGSLPSGSYRFVIEALDRNLNFLRTSPSSDIIRIYNDEGTIRINLRDIDENQIAFFRVHVIQYTSRTGSPEIIGLNTTYPSSTKEIIFEGIDIDGGDFLSTVEKVTIDPIIYETSREIQQVDNRVIKSNVLEKTKDYKDYQKSASKIKAYYKIFETLDDRTGLMPDEIYGLGIVYEHKDGHESPGFEILGNCELLTSDIPIRNLDTTLVVTVSNYNNPNNEPANFTIEYSINGETKVVTKDIQRQGVTAIDYYDSTSDTVNIISLTSTDNIIVNNGIRGYSGNSFNNYAKKPFDKITEWSSDIAHIVEETEFDRVYPNGIDYWKVFNTSIKLGADRGLMGYYQCESTYNTPTNYECAEDFWGEDSCGNKVTGTKRRFHRMPSRNIEPSTRIDSDGNVYRRYIGLTFENIEYPSDDIIGHYFTYTPKTSNTKTVLDTGLLNGINENDDYIVNSYFDRTENVDKHHYVYTPLTLKENVEADYISIYNEVRPQGIVHEVHDYQEAAADYGGDDLQLGIRYISLKDYTEEFSNHNIKEDYFLKPTHRTSTDNKGLVNLSLMNSVLITELDSSLKRKYIGLKRLRNNLYCNPETIKYTKLHSCRKTLNGDQDVFAGDSFISNFTVFNGFFAGLDENNMDKLKAAITFAVSVALSVFTGGASLVASAITGAVAAAVGVTVATVAALLDDIQLGRYASFLEDDQLTGSDGSFLGFGDGFVLFNNEIISNLYIDSYVNYEHRVSENETCKKVLDVPNNVVRVVSSPVPGSNLYTFTPEARSVIKAYLEDKYIMIADDGDMKAKPVPCPERYEYNKDHQFIKKLKEYFALPLTYNYCSDCRNKHPNRIIYSNPDFVESESDSFRVFLNESFALVGENTGQITGLHYDKNRILVRTEQSRFSLSPNPQVLNTDEGIAYLGTGDFLSIPPTEFVHTNYGYAGGQGRLDEINTEFGLISVDNRVGEIYLINSNGIENISSPQYGCYQWFKENLPSNNPETAIQLVYDPYFKRFILVHKENKWTMSFDLKRKRWISFHSYIPDYIYNDGTTMYSAIGNDIKKHNFNSNFTKYHDTKYNFEIEIEPFNYHTTDLNCVYYYAQTFEGDYEVDFPTFDNIWAYTNKQSTGVVALLPENTTHGYGNSLNWSNAATTVTNSEGNFRICQFRDIQKETPIWQLNNVYNKLPINFDFNKNQYELMPIKDKEVRIKFFFKPKTDNKLVFDLIETINKNSVL